MQVKLYIPNARAMLNFGKKLAHACTQPLSIYLTGNLGAGKTTLVRGFLQGLGHKGAVKSPTYTLVEPYHLGSKIIYHLDLYRLANAEELEFMGIRDYFAGNAFCLVEWPERGANFLPSADINCAIDYYEKGRVITVQALSEKGNNALEAIDISLNRD